MIAAALAATCAYRLRSICLRINSLPINVNNVTLAREVLSEGTMQRTRTVRASTAALAATCANCSNSICLEINNLRINVNNVTLAREVSSEGPMQRNHNSACIHCSTCHNLCQSLTLRLHVHVDPMSSARNVLSKVVLRVRVQYMQAPFLHVLSPLPLSACHPLAADWCCHNSDDAHAMFVLYTVHCP